MYTMIDASGFAHKGTMKQLMALSASVALPAVIDGALVIEKAAPIVATKTPRKVKPKLELVERTDEDAAVAFIGSIPRATVSVLKNDADDKSEKIRWNDTICAALTLTYKPIDQERPAAMTTPKTKTPAKKKAAPKKAAELRAAEPQKDVALPSAVKLTREEWLMKMTRNHMVELFARSGATLPEKLRISCGWPSQRALAGKKGRVMGQCWSPSASSDQTWEIFVTPACADPLEVAAILAHELVHACMPKGAGHGKLFRTLATEIGLEGKMTATVAGEWLKGWMKKAIDEVGAYPHAVLDMSQQKKQSTRLLKVICENEECEFFQDEEKPYSVRMSASVFEAGAPKCGCCKSTMIEAPTKEK
jgi:hypothetical protein